MLLEGVFTKTLRDHWRAIVGWSVGLALMTAIELAVFPSVQDQAQEMRRLVESYPEAMRAFLGMTADFTTGPGFLEVELFSFLVPLVTLAVGVGLASGATAGEEERGTLDLLLSMPVSRRSVVLRKALAVLVALAVVGATLALTILLGALWVDVEVSSWRVVTACLSAVLLGSAYGAIALAVAAATGRRWLAAGTSVGLALGAFLLHGLAPLVEGLQPWRPASPFWWYAGDGPLSAGTTVPHVLGLVAVTLVATAVAVMAFERHDVRHR